MKITLEEAYKKSTDYPLQTKDGGHAWGGRQFVVGADGVAMAECQHDGVHDPKIHAALLAHAFNVLPDVKSTMKYISENIRTLSRLAIQQQLDDAIAKVSTVEIP